MQKTLVFLYFFDTRVPSSTQKFNTKTAWTRWISFLFISLLLAFLQALEDKSQNFHGSIPYISPSLFPFFLLTSLLCYLLLGLLATSYSLLYLFLFPNLLFSAYPNLLFLNVFVEIMNEEPFKGKRNLSGWFDEVYLLRFSPFSF